MVDVLLNRDMRGGDVPSFRATDLDPPGGSHPAAWADLWRFALAFDPDRFREGTGQVLDPVADLERVRRDPSAGALGAHHLTTLRSALWAIFWETGQGASVDPQTVRLIDALLDAMYADVTGGAARPLSGPPAAEPGIGLFGASIGEGQHRFWFHTQTSLSRLDIYDRVAGLLLREIDREFILSALYLYPPAYSMEKDGRPMHVFMLLLVTRGGPEDSASRRLPEQYTRLTRLAVGALGTEAPGV
jgi:hypothetical protein